MLTEPLLCVVGNGERGGSPGGVRPRWLATRDEVWVRTLLDELDALVGRSVDDAERALDALVLPGAPPRATAGMCAVLRRLWKSTVITAAPPLAVRRVVFEAAARPGVSREHALAGAAAALHISVADALASLHADRPGARKVIAPESIPSPREAIERYHLALVQGLIFRSESLVVRVREHVRAVVRFAKLKGLLCTYGGTFGADGSGTRIDLSGPLSLFRHTTKYGHALASFFPAVAATPGWSIEAQVILRGQRVCLTAAAGDPIASAHALPCDSDSAVERSFARDLRRLGSAWTLEREAAAVQAGAKVFFPDFTLRRGTEVVHVEIVGYYTPEYLRSKLETFRRAGLRNLVVCIDEALACEEGEIAAEEVVRYRKRVKAAAVIEAAERVLRGV